MRWLIQFTKIGEREFGAIDGSERPFIVARLGWLSENFENLQPVPLHAHLRDRFKFRIGDWRVLYTFNTITQVILIYNIDRRDKVYKRK